MKHALRRIAAFAVLAALICSVGFVANASSYALGDVNGDGNINTVDANMALMFYVDASGNPLSDAQRTAADVDKNGAVNTVDANLILQHYVGTCGESCPMHGTSGVVTVSSEAELIAANSDPDCEVIDVAASFAVTHDMIIDKDIRVLDGCTLGIQSTVQCNGKVTLVGTGKIADTGGLFTVEFGIETIEELDDNWG